MGGQSKKVIPIIGCCGLDCGLCPRYYTEGKSKCDGCGSEYSYAAVGCKISRCCVNEKEFETCAECMDFPCSRFRGAWEEFDSFLTHRRMRSNLTYIREKGVENYVHRLEKRMKLLGKMLEEFNDGRSKSYYCIATTLLPITDLETSLTKAEQKIEAEKIELDDFKTKAKILKDFLNKFAEKKGVELKLRKKPKVN